MSQNLKEATRTPADQKLKRLLKREVKAHYPELKGAEIFVALVDGKRDDWPGNISLMSEMSWLASGGADGTGVDFLLELNQSLYDAAGEEARCGMLGNLLSRANAKSTGKTHQAHAKGSRQLYGVRKPVFGIDPEAVERCPQVIESIPALRDIQLALQPGEQYKLFHEQEAAKLAKLDEFEKVA